MASASLAGTAREQRACASPQETKTIQVAAGDLKEATAVGRGVAVEGNGR